MNNVTKPRPINGDEVDVCSKFARRVICALNRAGVCKKIKTKMNRRFRHQFDWKKEIEENDR